MLAAAAKCPTARVYEKFWKSQSPGEEEEETHERGIATSFDAQKKKNNRFPFSRPLRFPCRRQALQRFLSRVVARPCGFSCRCVCVPFLCTGGGGGGAECAFFLLYFRNPLYDAAASPFSASFFSTCGFSTWPSRALSSRALASRALGDELPFIMFWCSSMPC